MERKRELLDTPHVASLSDLVRALSAERGATVPWFDPTEAGTEARILMLFENPGRRADAAQGSGFISADNDDQSAENMWGLLRSATAIAIAASRVSTAPSAHEAFRIPPGRIGSPAAG